MIIKKQKDEIIGYLEDSSNFRQGKAEAVYIPEDEDEIVEIIKECTAARLKPCPTGKITPLTISAGGTGTVGARIPLEGAILSVEKLNRIISINACPMQEIAVRLKPCPTQDDNKKTAVLQAGVIIDNFLKALEPEGLFYPPFPTERTAFIGGNVSTNASGEYSYRFGPTRKYVRRIRVILSSGEKIDIRRGEYMADANGYIQTPQFKVKIPSYISPSVKNSAGYFSRPGMDLIDLFIGSEGTLGVITEVEVELIPALPPRFIMITFFANDDVIPGFLKEVKSGKKVSPLSVEYFDSNSLEFLKKDFPNIPECACAIYIEDEESEEVFDKWVNLIEGYEVIDTWISKDEKSYREFIDFRHKLPENVNEYFRKIKSTKLAIDASVPENVFPDFFALYRKIQKEIKIQTIRFGHIGENHLHFNFFPTNEEEKAVVTEIFEDILRRAIAAGGTISAEHGVGKIKHKYLEMMYGKKGIMEMVRVKKEIDPYCIFGLDNIFPKCMLDLKRK